LGRVLITAANEYLAKNPDKRDGESYHQAFARKFENDISFRRDWQTIADTKMSLALSKSMASLQPTSTEVGSSATSDDSAAEAVRLLGEMAAKNGRSFEEVFADPANRALANRTYTRHHLPELQR
jgi:hypothetical protein